MRELQKVVYGCGLEGVFKGRTVDGVWGLTLPAPAGPMTSTPNFDIVKKRSGVGGGVNLLKSPLHGLGQVGEAEEEGYLPMRS